MMPGAASSSPWELDAAVLSQLADALRSLDCVGPEALDAVRLELVRRDPRPNAISGHPQSS